MTLFTDYRELGAIAAAASEASGKTVTNPYPEGSEAARLFDEGYAEECERMAAEPEDL